MSKKFLTGVLLGGAATGAAWTLLSADKKAAIKKAIDEKVDQATDFATNYALDALDIVDEKLAETEYRDTLDNVTSGVSTAKEKAKKKADQLVDHLTNDDFDEQTADIREQLAAEQDNAADDIVIDTTKEKQDTDDQD